MANGTDIVNSVSGHNLLLQTTFFYCHFIRRELTLLPLHRLVVLIITGTDLTREISVTHYEVRKQITFSFVGVVTTTLVCFCKLIAERLDYIRIYHDLESFLYHPVVA